MWKYGMLFIVKNIANPMRLEEGFYGASRCSCPVRHELYLLGNGCRSGNGLFCEKEASINTHKAFLGFAAGVMIAASVWSLLIPAIDMAREQGKTNGCPL